MSNEIATRTPQQELVARVRDEGFKEQVAMVLPPTVTPEKFIRIAATAVLTNPDIAKLEHNSVLRAMVQAASIGLMPDGKHAAIVGRGGQASFMAMVLGYRQIAADYGWTLKDRVVHADDAFEYSEEPPILRHQPTRPGVDRGDRIAAYCIATHRDGRRVERVMYADEILKRREMATTKQIWDKWPEEMWAKTPTRDVFLDLPLSDSDLEVNRIRRIIEESDLDPGEAKRLLYGGTAAEKSGVTTAPSSQTTTSPPPGGDGDAIQQVDSAAATPVQTRAAAEPVPGENDDEEIANAAKEAALLVPPTGVHASAGRTLAQIHGLGADGARWFGMAMRKQDLDATFQTALFNYARVYLPELFNEVIAEREVAE